MVYYIALFALLFAGLSSFLYIVLKIPSVRAGRLLRASIHRKENGRLLKIFVDPFVVPLSALIPMKPIFEANLAQQLCRAGTDIAPKEYYARALILAVLSLSLSGLIAILGLPQAVPVTIILSVIIFFHCITAHKDALKAKQERIELGLPGFIRSILHKLPEKSIESNIDLIVVFEDYLKVANEVFFYDVAYLITEMKSKDNKTALRNFDARIGLTEVTFLVQALIGLDKGEDQSDALAHLARDVDLKARENIRKQLAKRPGQVRLATIPLVIVAIATLLYVIVTHLFQAVGGLF